MQPTQAGESNNLSPFPLSEYYNRIMQGNPSEPDNLSCPATLLFPPTSTVPLDETHRECRMVANWADSGVLHPRRLSEMYLRGVGGSWLISNTPRFGWLYRPPSKNTVLGRSRAPGPCSRRISEKSGEIPPADGPTGGRDLPFFFSDFGDRVGWVPGIFLKNWSKQVVPPF